MIKLLITLFLGITSLGSADAPKGYVVSDKARDFNLKNVDGNFVSMVSNKDAKGYIIIFTCNSCPYSVAYEDRIISLHNKYAPMGYPVIAINPNDPEVQPADSFEKMQERSESKKFTFPYVIDATQEITLAYGATNTPHVYLLERVNKDYIVRYVGAIDNNTRDGNLATKKYVESAIESLLDNQEVATSSTKAIGCTIKWSSASKEFRQNN